MVSNVFISSTQLALTTPRLHGTTPGKGRGGGEDGGAGGAAAAHAEEEPFNPAAVLKTLPNATTAAYWLRRAAREEANGGVFVQVDIVS